MWLYKRPINSIIAMSFKPQCITYAHIQKTGSDVPFKLVRIRSYMCNNLELEKEILFNQYKVSKFLHDEICAPGLSDADIRISLEGPSIIEKQVSADYVHTDEFKKQMQSMIWDYILLGKQDEIATNAYIGGISREVLFQYQLMAIKHNFGLTCITTRTAALLQIMAHEMQQIKTLNDLEQHITLQSLSSICSDLSPQQNLLLQAELIGLCMARIEYEHY